MRRRLGDDAQQAEFLIISRSPVPLQRAMDTKRQGGRQNSLGGRGYCGAFACLSGFVAGASVLAAGASAFGFAAGRGVTITTPRLLKALS